jgi:plastocyanin
MRARVRTLGFILAVAILGMVAAPSAEAVHFYRGPGGGCTPAEGPVTDDASASGSAAATVSVLHNTFNDFSNGTPITTIQAGEAIQWDWNSSHCHSVKFSDGPEAFYSGYHYPAPEPELGPAVAPGVFHFPVPDLTADLSYTHTFDTPGTYSYICEHHAAIGMVGTIIVE